MVSTTVCFSEYGYLSISRPVSAVSLDQVCLIWGGTVQHASILGKWTDESNVVDVQAQSAVRTWVSFYLKFLLQPVLLSCVWLLALLHPSERAASGCTVRSLLVWMNSCFLVLWCWLCREASYRKRVPGKSCRNNGWVSLILFWGGRRLFFAC